MPRKFGEWLLRSELRANFEIHLKFHIFYFILRLSFGCRDICDQQGSAVPPQLRNSFKMSHFGCRKVEQKILCDKQGRFGTDGVGPYRPNVLLRDIDKQCRDRSDKDLLCLLTVCSFEILRKKEDKNHPAPLTLKMGSSY